MRLALSVFLGLGLFASTASASLNDPYCRPSPTHPHPVVLVHGRGGDVNGFGALVSALERAGHCVYGTNYGQVGGSGPHGMDHLTVSGAQVRGFIEKVRLDTKSTKVNVIGHSAGTGVLDNIILEKGAGDLIHRLVSFGGLHHPYAHAGVAKFADSDLFLPNLVATARLVDPKVDAQTVIKGAIALYAGAGGSLAGIDTETASSNFAADLFDPEYWKKLHAGLSEPALSYIKVGDGNRTLKTKDSIPSICYTNIVGAGDLLTGGAAGFQDNAPNVDNWLLPTASDHSQILADPLALAKTLLALDTPCVPKPTTTDPPPDGTEPSTDSDAGTEPSGDAPPGDAAPAKAAAAAEADRSTTTDEAAGCACTSSSAPSPRGALFALLSVLALIRRRSTR